MFTLIKNKFPASAIGFLVIIGLFVTIGSFTLRGLITQGELTRTIYDHPLVVSNAALNAALGVTKMHRDMKDVVLSNTLAEVEAILESVAQNEQFVYAQLDVIRHSILGTEGLALQEQALQLFNDWKPIRQNVIKLYKEGKREKAIQITQAQGAEYVTRLENKMLELTSYARNKSTQFITSAKSS